MLMIRIGSSHGYYLAIDISKHVTKKDEDDHQYDLICAGVSSIGIGLANAIDSICPDSCNIDINQDTDDSTENHITITVKSNDEKLQTVLTTGVIQLMTVAQSYPDYIDLKNTEV